MIDNKEIAQVLDVLEKMEDEELAARLLKEFNESTKKLGVLILNKDHTLDHQEWKSLCDLAQAEVDQIVQKIMSV